ncbi:LON peptidase substrate-binding domain-containing protein [Idiomarina sp.]|uniref:LON peptidase substrate-binding domain-containing protein n=1 Tax=Idiomarina sp. TaxID=1874361 RepID=UPI0035111FD2
MDKVQRLPLFPLTAHVMPNGKLKLRIFEQRYTRLVKQCMANQSEFVVCMFDPGIDKYDSEYILPFGTAVTIIDFEMLNDGFLGITVQGERRVKIKHHEFEEDGLRVGDVEVLPFWQHTPITDEVVVLKERLEEIYGVYPELGDLYDEKPFEQLDWVCQRWLEILPLDVHTKQELIKSQSSEQVADYLLNLVT